jgi:hypothetical protein
VLIFKELHRPNTVGYFRTDVNNLLARFAVGGRLHALLCACLPSVVGASTTLVYGETTEPPPAVRAAPA